MFEGVVTGVIAGIILAILGAIFNKREAIIGAWKGTIASILRIASLTFNKFHSVFNAGLNTLRRIHFQVGFYLYRKGIVKMKVNLNEIPNVKETWDNPHLTSPAKKASYLATQLSKIMNYHDANQRVNLIRRLWATPAICVLLENNTLNSDVFCALVSAYVVEKAQEYSQERFQSFPVPYSIIEEIMKDLIGEEEEESQEADSES